MDTNLRDEGLIDVSDVAINDLKSMKCTPNLVKSRERILAGVKRKPVSSFNSAI